MQTNKFNQKEREKREKKINKQVWLDAWRYQNGKNFKISSIAWASLWIRFKVIQLVYA